MRKRIHPLFPITAGMAIALAVIGSHTTSFAGNVGGRSYSVGASRITEDALARHIDFFTSPDLEGRANGTPGAEAAAGYIEDEIRAIGLAPGVADSGFIQTYGADTGVRVEGVIGMRDLARGYEFNTDYTPIGISGDGHLTTSLVFAGYGITAPEQGYDDYDGIDVRGKIVLVFLGEPGMNDPANPFNGAAATPYSRLYRKAVNARDRGAAGILLTEGPLYSGETDPVWKISSTVAHRDAGLMVCQVTRAAAQALVGPMGIDLRTLQERIDRDSTPQSLDFTESKIELMVKMRRQDTELVNIVGRIPGSGNDALVVVAHYDGPGMGEDNARRALHPGANGNAAGVAALLEIAKAYQRLPKPERTIYFAAVSGEMLDGLGLQVLVGRGISSTDRSIIAISLNALGRPVGKNLTLFARNPEPDWLDRIEEVNAGVSDGVDVRFEELLELVGHEPVWRETLGSTLSVQGGPDPRIGTPRDDPDSMDYPGLVRNTRFLYGLIQALANAETR